MPTTPTISASEFKANCLNIFDRLADHEPERVIITKGGKPVAVLTPPERQADAVRDNYGFMRRSVAFGDDVHPTAAVPDESFTADTDDLPD